MRLPHAPQFIREVVGVSADLVTIAGVIVVLAPAIIGIVAHSLIAALIAALAMAMLVILACLYRIRQLVQQHVGLRRAALDLELRTVFGQTVLRGIQSEVGHEGDDSGATDSSARGVESSPWLSDLTDPASFSMSKADFEACCERATEIAKGKGDRALKTIFDNVTVVTGEPWMPRNVIWVSFWVHDVALNMDTSVKFIGSLDAYESYTRDSGPSVGEPVSYPDAPWRDDPCWATLWEAAVQKVQQRSGVFVLTAVPRGEIANDSLWAVGIMPDDGELRIFSWSAASRLVEH